MCGMVKGWWWGLTSFTRSYRHYSIRFSLLLCVQDNLKGQNWQLCPNSDMSAADDKLLYQNRTRFNTNITFNLSMMNYLCSSSYEFVWFSIMRHFCFYIFCNYIFYPITQGSFFSQQWIETQGHIMFKSMSHIVSLICNNTQTEYFWKYFHTYDVCIQSH